MGLMSEKEKWREEWDKEYKLRQESFDNSYLGECVKKTEDKLLKMEIKEILTSDFNKYENFELNNAIDDLFKLVREWNK